MLKIGIAMLCFPAFFLSGFAVPQKSRQAVQATPWIGISLDQGYKGVLINGVLPGAPGDEAGLAPGDEVMEVDRKSVKDPNEFGSLIRSCGVGDFVELRILRKGAVQTRRIKLAARPDTLEMLNKQLLGKPLPAFNLKTIPGGARAASESFKGKVLLIEFWGTWCAPCRATHPRLSEFARANRGKGLEVVGISEEDEAIVRSYVEKEKPAFLALNDPSHAIQEKFFIMVLPTFVVVDKNGTIVSTGVGGGYYLDEAMKAAEKALQEK